MILFPPFDVYVQEARLVNPPARLVFVRPLV